MDQVRAEDGCFLWTAETGRGEPLIMCHGGPGLWDMTGSLAAALAPRLHIIRWDQRGCGRSERRGPYSVARCVADLDAILGPRAKAALFGHSWGATLALPGRDLRPRWAVDSLERALPGVRRVVLPEAGHIPWLETPGEFTRPLLHFLAQAVHP